jgi:hypothetical protein
MLRRINLGSAKGDWKLVWTTLLPTSTGLFDLSKDPSKRPDGTGGQHLTQRRRASGENLVRCAARVWVLAGAIEVSRPRAR